MHLSHISYTCAACGRVVPIQSVGYGAHDPRCAVRRADADALFQRDVGYPLKQDARMEMETVDAAR